MRNRYFNKKIFTFILFVLLLFAGIAAVTQESNDFEPDIDHPAESHDVPLLHGEEIAGHHITQEFPDWVKPARWFRSNAGGMALEEIPSMYASLRNRFALVIDFVDREDMPEYLSPYFNDNYFIEVRKLYENAIIKRIQWIFRDINGTVRLISAYSEAAAENKEPSAGLTDDSDTDEDDEDNEENEENEKMFIIQTNEKVPPAERSPYPDNGFIEIFDSAAFLTTEYKFISNNERSRTDYNYKDEYKISAVFYLWQEVDTQRSSTTAETENTADAIMRDGIQPQTKEFVKTHTDYFFYNRSAFLRAVERVFHTDTMITPKDNAVYIAFPSDIFSAAGNDYFMNEKLNPYPEFFSDIFIHEDSRMLTTTDERGRIHRQTLLDDEDNIIWEVQNIWLDERILSIRKTEGELELLAEFEYDSDGNRIMERNLRNGILERMVRTEGNLDIEELYINSTAILQAVWEDGRKISETRF